ncbi:kinase-like domain-containing protein [Fennellomyces sp. T-0311]|nr:kinase-like domain-containing protein [Fennellomyces sp. T-0311]
MQENDRRNIRRSSEAEVRVNRPDMITRVPLPLPYLPSDYEPSPTSPRHRFWTNHFPTVMRRQRSRSAGHSESSLLPALPAPPFENSDGLALTPPPSSFEIVPYRDWTVISRNDVSGQMVLYNRESRIVTVRQHVPSDTDDDAHSPMQLASAGKCPLCHRPFSRRSSSPKEDNQPDFMDRNYFRLLASTTPIQSPRTTQGRSNREDDIPGMRLNANAFNEGYYEKFFVERKKLGRGFRGSVYLCEVSMHELDGVKLGKYAVKKVAVGNNHPWLVKMLREVHLLERLRHPNIINYKHAWLEYNRLTPFGPEIPCLFILMECANGGNLEEYMEPEILRPPEKPANKPNDPKSAKERKRARIRRQLEKHQQTEDSAPSTHTQKRLLSMPEIWSLFLDIVEGLAHLHQQNIVHRDLKPPNLLLKPRVLISDFGECEDLEGVPDSDRTGATGTLEFMAPEHVRLDPRGRHMKEYSPKADMWSLGMVLYYLCYTKLPYTNVDDIDLLQEEILAFREVEFPKNRFDIYKGMKNPVDPALAEAMRDQDVPEQIPPELKLLIRMLLSTDPEKRPSCEEILNQIRNMPRYMEESSVFGSPSSSNGNGTTSSNAKKARRPSWRAPDAYFSPTLMKNESSRESVQDDTGSKRRKKDPQVQDQELLIRADDIPAPEVIVRGDMGLRSVKMMTALLKIATCTYPCYPYAPSPSILYPVILLAMLDFWRQSISHSLLLVAMHVTWVVMMAVFSGGICVA